MAYYRSEHLCACGCGLTAKKLYDVTGRFKQYCKYADGHKARELSKKRREMGERNRGMGSPRALPMFSKRIHFATDNMPYYVIKVQPSGRWMYEHRHLYEQYIKRKLLPTEIVHHLNGDTLDNRIENLKLMSGSEHSSFHHAGNSTHNHCGRKLPEGRWSEHFSRCTICGLTTSHHASRGVCHNCYMYHYRTGRYKNELS